MVKYLFNATLLHVYKLWIMGIPLYPLAMPE